MGAKLSRELARLKPYVPLCTANAAIIRRLGNEAEVKDTIEELSPDLLAMVRQAQERKLAPLPGYDDDES